MKYLLPLLVLCFTGCNDSQTKLDTGKWSGVLIPMNHPEMESPVSYDVSYIEDELLIVLTGSGGDIVNTENISYTGDSLFFSFPEPEMQMNLDCRFGANDKHSFEGKCTDAEGKWASFTMNYTGGE